METDKDTFRPVTPSLPHREAYPCPVAGIGMETDISA
jgi:hypothetical protein